MQTIPFESLYGSMIAGAIPAHKGDLEQSVAYLAEDALNTSAIHYHFVHNKEETKAFYFAVPSKDLASIPYPATPLAAAIPGAAGHLGEGAYVVSSEGLSAAAIYKDGDLRLLFNTSEVMDRYLSETGLTVYEAKEQESGLLSSSRSRGRTVATKLASVTSKISTLVVLACAGTWFTLGVAQAYMSAKVEDAYSARSRALAKVAEDINFNSPLSQQIGRVHSLATVALENKGWIERFELKNGKVAYTVAVAENLKAQALKKLGPGHEESYRDGLVYLTFMDGKPAGEGGEQSAQSRPAEQPAALAHQPTSPSQSSSSTIPSPMGAAPAPMPSAGATVQNNPGRTIL